MFHFSALVDGGQAVGACALALTDRRSRRAGKKSDVRVRQRDDAAGPTRRSEGLVGKGRTELDVAANFEAPRRETNVAGASAPQVACRPALRLSLHAPRSGPTCSSCRKNGAGDEI